MRGLSVKLNFSSPISHLLFAPVFKRLNIGMKILFLMAALFLFGANAFGQQASPWTKMGWLVGDWKGGRGEPGKGSGGFTFKLDLDGRVLVRKAHSEYPATADKPAIVLDDLMIVYLDPSGGPSKPLFR